MNGRDAVLTIDRFNLRLPAGFERRGDAIARETLRLLSRSPLGFNAVLPRLDIAGIQIHGGETNGVIARRICRAIEQQIARQAPQRSRVTGVMHAD
jgi:hypothetical protein